MTIAATITVTLPERTAVRLMELRCSRNELLSEVIQRLAEQEGRTYGASKDSRSGTTSGRGRYEVRLLGEIRTVHSLSDVLVWTFNALADLDGTILERLENVRGRTRRAVARTRETIHPGRADLNMKYTLEFRPGWWTGTNHSYRDVRRILALACREAGLVFGEDVEIRRIDGDEVNLSEERCLQNFLERSLP